ncbi:hypothetical protein WMY93_031381 [Mugilogobius chulae]|uniref:Uncharacterized protein n=1 Tax=Mugilogobius chulae TaxID=88201 RepID=A0AAW0MN74_9GOBI
MYLPCRLFRLLSASTSSEQSPSVWVYQLLPRWRRVSPVLTVRLTDSNMSTRGLLPRKRPELLCVLERRHREERERRERPLSDLDRHLQTRRLRSRALDSDDERKRRQSEPEFVKVKGALRHISGFCR